MTSLQTDARSGKCCGRSWWSSGPEAGPSPGRAPADPGTLVHSHQTSSICKSHRWTSDLDGAEGIWTFIEFVKWFVLSLLGWGVLEPILAVWVGGLVPSDEPSVARVPCSRAPWHWSGGASCPTTWPPSIFCLHWVLDNPVLAGTVCNTLSYWAAATTPVLYFIKWLNMGD